MLFAGIYNKMMGWAAHPHAERYLIGVSVFESIFFPVPTALMVAPMAIARPERAVRIALIATTTSVLGGVVGFIGLLVPFLLRPLVGPRHRILIPASAIGGALAVVIADTLARTVAAPSEIPLGLITAAVGGPFLGWLLLRRRPT